MMTEGHLNFSDQQSLSGTSNIVSTNVYSAGAAKSVFGGVNRKARLAIQVTAAGGTDPTFRARLVAADNAALTTNPVTLADTGTHEATGLPLMFELLPGMQATKKLYYGIVYTLGGTDPTATVNAQVTMDPQSAGIR